MITSNIKKEFNCDLEKVWNIVTDNTKYAWRSDVSKIEIIDDTHFTEYGKNNFPTHFCITKKEYPGEYRFDIKNSHIQGEWIGIFKKTDSGVLLDFTEKIETAALMKFPAKLFLKMQQKRYMADLEKELQKRS